LTAVRRHPAGGQPVACAVLLPSGTARADQFFGVTPDDRLVHFTAQDPAFRAPVKLTGLGAMGHVVAIDARTATGGLFGITLNGATARLVRIDQTSGAVTPIGAAFGLTTPPNGLGLDFDPVTDLIAFVAGNDINLDLDPDTGAASFKEPPSPATASFVDVAYIRDETYSLPVALDTNLDRLVIGDGSGTYLGVVNPLGVAVNGFATADFSPSSLLWLLIGNQLYRAEMLTGIASGAGAIAEPLTAMAVQLTGDAGNRAARTVRIVLT